MVLSQCGYAGREICISLTDAQASRQMTELNRIGGTTTCQKISDFKLQIADLCGKFLRVHSEICNHQSEIHGACDRCRIGIKPTRYSGDSGSNPDASTLNRQGELRAQ